MIKRTFKAMGMLLIFGVSLGSLYLVNLFLMKPVSIDHFLGKEFLIGLTDSPESMTYIGIFDQFNWITKHNSKLSISNPDDLQGDIKDAKKTLRILNKYKNSSLSDNQKITKSIAIFDTGNNLKQLEKFPYHDYLLNQVRGAHHNVISFMSDMHPIRNLSEAKDFIKRTNLVIDVYSGLLSWLERQAAEGIYAPKFVYAHLIKQLDELINYSIEEHPLYTQFIKKTELLNISENQLADLGADLKSSIENSVTPGFVLLRDFMVSTRDNANPHHGIWSQPNGDEFYKLRIRSYTTTDYSPQKIHDLGISEVARISSRMKEILVSLGYDASKTAGTLMNELNEDPSMLYADTPDRKKIVVQDYMDMVTEATEGIKGYFHTMPKSPVIVIAAPEYSEKTAPGGWYQSPALDGSRPGAFYVNLYDIKQTPKYSMKTLAYHEATPGHHHQIAHSLENDDLTLYRRFGYGTSAFSEGWALYSEQLALEAGLAPDPYDELGILQSEIFRAVRLVVDTGIHYKKWTREEAIAYMKAKTGMSDTECRVEIERYIVWPGQALSYKVGMIKILELREKAMNALGDKFNIKDFHSAVLDHGNPPLFIVEQKIDEMISEGLKNN
ncbi:DUF885 domain-containing protein [Gammaproteobacteria bacterium]|nr:DUF885 domain-containing protein [Gammaproteobacteria bacterium]